MSAPIPAAFNNTGGNNTGGTGKPSPGCHLELVGRICLL